VTGKERLAFRLARQPRLEEQRQGGLERLDVAPAALAVHGLHRNCRVHAFLVERLGRQRLHFLGAKPGSSGDAVQDGAVNTRQPAAISSSRDSVAPVTRFRENPYHQQRRQGRFTVATQACFAVASGLQPWYQYRPALFLQTDNVDIQPKADAG
jgi:hypothetical protein